MKPINLPEADYESISWNENNEIMIEECRIKDIADKFRLNNTYMKRKNYVLESSVKSNHKPIINLKYYGVLNKII